MPSSCQRHLCQQVRDAGGDYLLLAKENQPTLYADIRLLFDPPPDSRPLPLLDHRDARTVDRGHGRRDDVRHLVASTDLTGYLAWPGVAQVFRLHRSWSEKGVAKQELHYGLTSLPPRRGRQTDSWPSNGHIGALRIACTASRMWPWGKITA